jgi:hypothetical protein
MVVQGDKAAAVKQVWLTQGPGDELGWVSDARSNEFLYAKKH